MKTEWEDILPEEFKVKEEDSLEIKNAQKIANIMRDGCIKKLYQAEKEGKVAINPPTVSELDMLIRSNVMYDYTQARVGTSMAMFYADQLTHAITDRIRKR